MRLATTPPKGAGKSQGVTKTERMLQIIEGLGQDKATFLPLGIRTSELPWAVRLRRRWSRAASNSALQLGDEDDPARWVFTPSQVLALGDFLHGTQGVWRL